MSQPNVLFIITDQQRFDAVRAFGNSLIYTPNIDRIAKNGVWYKNAYSLTPVCVPARYSIMSGLQSPSLGIFDNTVPSGSHHRIVKQFGFFLPEIMNQLGYHTFGVGKFHTTPWNADLGFSQQLYSEEFYLDDQQRRGDHYANWIATAHSHSNWIEALMGERSEMYYMPQMSPLPAECTVEAWATDQVLPVIESSNPQPWFAYVSYIGPHPPFAPPLPYNRMYNPDMIPLAPASCIEIDHLDQQIPWMNYAVFAESVDPVREKVLKARYYGEISYIDSCIGRILDAVELKANGRDTVICFASDHGDLLGDHHGWQKESFFEGATRIPFIISWPGVLPENVYDNSLVSLVDLFGVATSAAGSPMFREGRSLLAPSTGNNDGGDETVFFGYHGQPGTIRFKAMVRCGKYKFIWMANGNNTLLFDMLKDPNEISPLQEDSNDLKKDFMEMLVNHTVHSGLELAMDDGKLRFMPYEEWTKTRIYQFDRSRGVSGFPSSPSEVRFNPP